MGFEPNVDVADEDAEAFRDRMQEGMEEAKAALVKAQDEYARYYNRRRDLAPVFEPGGHGSFGCIGYPDQSSEQETRLHPPWTV